MQSLDVHAQAHKNTRDWSGDCTTRRCNAESQVPCHCVKTTAHTSDLCRAIWKLPQAHVWPQVCSGLSGDHPPKWEDLDGCRHEQQNVELLIVLWWGGRECLPFVNSETSSICHVPRFCCIKWCSDAFHLAPNWVSTNSKGPRGKGRWKAGSLEKKNIWHGICHCLASADWFPSAHIQSCATFFAKEKFFGLDERHSAAILAGPQPTGICLLAVYWNQSMQCLSSNHNRPENIRWNGKESNEQWTRTRLSPAARASDTILKPSSIHMVDISSETKQ